MHTFTFWVGHPIYTAQLLHFEYLHICEPNTSYHALHHDSLIKLVHTYCVVEPTVTMKRIALITATHLVVHSSQNAIVAYLITLINLPLCDCCQLIYYNIVWLI